MPAYQFKTVTKYVLTFINPDGRRVLLGPMNERSTYPTEKAALKQLGAIIKNNPASILKQSFGDVTKIEVRPCECHTNGDPVQVYFD
jgi:hypothetical protein